MHEKKKKIQIEQEALERNSVSRRDLLNFVVKQSKEKKKYS